MWRKSPALNHCTLDPSWQVTIEYRNLTVEADALVGAAGVPSVGQSAAGTLKRLLCQVGASSWQTGPVLYCTFVLRGACALHWQEQWCRRLASRLVVGSASYQKPAPSNPLSIQGGLPTKRLTVLHGISGRLVPGRITLLQGGPCSALPAVLRPPHAAADDMPSPCPPPLNQARLAAARACCCRRWAGACSPATGCASAARSSTTASPSPTSTLRAARGWWTNVSSWGGGMWWITTATSPCSTSVGWCWRCRAGPS